MSPQNKKKFNLLRKQLDKLDNNLLRIIKKRTNIVKNVLNIKEYKYEIVDKKRINKILSNIKKKSLKHKIDPNITKRIWKNMIWAYISFEKKNFKKK
jgi:chorismate mutase|tara:strand:- start:1293 stop:1583 length:291 start_codon:yes stop_codon:yes gene_type:complete